MICFLSCHKYVRGKRGKSSFLPFYPLMPQRKRVILQKNVIAVFDPDYQCFVAVAERFFGSQIGGGIAQFL
jgi:hypothetical protein